MGPRKRKQSVGRDVTPVNGKGAPSSFHFRTFSALGIVCGLIAFIAWATQQWRREPLVYGYRIVKRYDHDPAAFTQGLLWLNGSMYESVGLYGKSAVREVRLLEDGGYEVVRETKIDPNDFAEGLTYHQGELVQLLWRVPDVYHYSVASGPDGHLERKINKRSKTQLKDGWGLESDGSKLYATDSGSYIHHLDPTTLKTLKSVQIKDGEKVIEMANELELVDGELWANMFGSDCIARVSPETGLVRGWIDFTGLLDKQKEHRLAKQNGRDPPDVFNGIAWDASSRRLFVTGKNWPNLYEVEVVLGDSSSLDDVRSRCIPPRNIFQASER